MKTVTTLDEIVSLIQWCLGKCCTDDDIEKEKRISEILTDNLRRTVDAK